MDLPSSRALHAALGALALITVGCSDDDPVTTSVDETTPVATSITLSTTSVSFSTLGRTLLVTTTVKDQRGGTMEGALVSWQSSDEGVATVSGGGLITANGNGSATITAMSGSASETLAAIVEQVPASVTLSRDTATLSAIGDTLRLAATVVDSSGAVIAAAAVHWSSSDTSVLTVDDGLVTAAAGGSATITGSSDGVGGVASISVFIGAGSALRFDGANDYAEIPGDLWAMGIRTAFTVSVWVKPQASGGMRMLLEDGTQFNTDAFYLGVTPGSDRIFARLNTSTGGVFSDNILVPPFADEWTHLALTYDGATFTAYFNGDVVYQPSITGEIRDGNRNLRIGYPSGENFYAGDVDELRIWDVALTQEEIQATMASPLLGSETGLVGYWRFDEGGGQSFGDASPTPLNGTLGSTAAPDDNDPTWQASDAPLSK